MVFHVTAAPRRIRRILAYPMCRKKGLHFLSEAEAINLAITYSRTTSGGTTIGGYMLNGRVRDGNVCFPSPVITRVEFGNVVQSMVWRFGRFARKRRF